VWVKSVRFLQPESLSEAVSLAAEHPEARPIAGGTDVLVELNFDRARPGTVLDLMRVPELATISRDNGTIRLGATVPFTQLIAEAAAELPGLAIAARTVGSPQIRNRGTVGGNLGTASPAGDALPPLVAVGAEVEVVSTKGTRRVAIEDFITAPKRTALQPGELIAAIHIPVASAPQQFSKIGTRNAMVISVASVALAVDSASRRINVALGSVGPTILRAPEAEEFLSGELAAAGAWDSPAPLEPSLVERFADLVSAAARPIDDVRGSARYRQHSVRILARRSLGWVWNDYRGAN
jgi:CO/xanthine dehydrogenase FAD-binding subunit